MKQTKIELILKQSQGKDYISMAYDEKIKISEALTIIQMAQNSILEKVREIAPQSALNSDMFFKSWVEKKSMKYLIQEINKKK